MNFDSSYERDEVVDHTKRRWGIVGVVLALGFAAAGVVYERSRPAAPGLAFAVPREAVYQYRQIAGGPRGRVVPAVRSATSWRVYAQGGSSRLAVLLTDQASNWLGLAHGLKAIGVPFTITTDPQSALKHPVVLAYPLISGRVLDGRATRAMSNYVRAGGVLVGFNVLEPALAPLFGFTGVHGSRSHTTINFNRNDPLSAQLRGDAELHIRFSDRVHPALNMGSYGYERPVQPPVASFEDGSTAIVRHRLGAGTAYAVGLDIGAFLLKGYNNREEHIAKNYVNDYEPALDVFLRLIRSLYTASGPVLTIGTVPDGKRFSAIVAHDVDSAVAIAQCEAYAVAERRWNISTTYFMQTKYVRDYNDRAFFDDAAGEMSARLERMGMEIASHSVSHSLRFASFPIGSGTEGYPGYVPFIQDPRHTYNATILGELRVSKYILEAFTHKAVLSFRPGNLANPFTLPQDAADAGYRFTSATTADDSLTHLPFQLDADRSTEVEVPVFEIPVTIEDEALPRMDRRELAAQQLTQKIASYGGVVSILIHPNITGYKLDFERWYVKRFSHDAYFGTYRDFGNWWSARNAVNVDTRKVGNALDATITAPQKISGLTLVLPANARGLSSSPAGIIASAHAQAVVLRSIQGTVHLRFLMH